MFEDPDRDCFSCVDIDCTIDNLLGNYFTHEVIDDGRYHVNNFYENIFDRFDDNEGFTKLICRVCGRSFVISNEKIPMWDYCPYCLHSETFEKSEVSMNNYDMSTDTVSMTCDKCKTKFYFSVKNFEEEEFDCPVCNSVEHAWIDIDTPIEKLPFSKDTLKQMNRFGIKTFGDISPTTLKNLSHRSETVKNEVLKVLEIYL